MHGFSGAKGGSGGSSSFKQRPDTLRSTDTFEGLLGLCAGPIKGLTRGLKSLKIDGTPLEDESGKLNFENFLAILADGDPTSFPQEVNLRLGAGGSPVAVNLALSNTNSSGPGPWVTKSIANTGADFLDFRFLVNQLYRQDKTGIFEHTANIEIQLKPTGTTNWISPMLGTPSQSYSQSGIPSSLAGQRVYIPRAKYDPSGNYKPETNLGYFKITGKTTSVAVHELRITVPNTDAYDNVGWDVRARLIEKESVDADPNFEKRTITWESVSAGYNTKLGVTEPWRGLAWLQVYGKASDQLTGVPTVEGEYDTLIVPVPPTGVFDPETRAYTTAIWDGSWARSFTTDPAWNINGLLSDALHGMASVSPGAHLNKWDALEASKWFSEMVPDGNGGTEPRYSLNIAINEPQKAAEFVPYLAGAVGALAWEENAGEWRIKADKPENPSDLFTLEAIEGEFRYSHTNVDTRFNDITVVFLNKEFGYREDRVRVVDSAHIARFGRKPTTIVAIGCTGRQEALRRAIMRLRVSTRETRMVNFTTNRRGRLVRPLSTILIADGDLGTLIDSDENTRSTGRIISVAPDRMSVTVRDPLRLELGVDYDVTFTLPNPDYAPDADVDPQGEDVTLPTITQTVALTNTAAQRGNVTTLHLASALPANVAPNANLALQATNLPALPKQYRVTHVEPDGERVAISAIEIDTGKWDASDSGVAEEGYVPPSNVVVPPVLNAVISTGSFESDYGTNLTLNVNWERPAGAMLAGYRTEYRVNGADWVRINSRTSLTSIEIVNPQFGKWDFRITTLDRAGRTSEPVVVSIVVDENLKPGYYADGTPIDDLKPAEPGATEGGTIGDNIKDEDGNVVPPEDLYTSLGISLDTFKVNGVASEDVLNAISTAQSDLQDLFDTYGDVASAAESADIAIANAKLAAAFGASQGMTPNGDLSQGITGWDGGDGENDGAGRPCLFVPAQNWNGAGTVLVNSTNVRQNMRERAHQVLPNRKYRVYWRYYLTAACANAVYIRKFDATGAYVNVVTAHTTPGSPPINTWIEGSFDFDTAALGDAAMFAISFNSNTAAAAATVGVDYLYVEDITESKAAEISATAASGSAAVASAEAATAASDRSLTAQYAANAFRATTAKMADSTHFTLNPAPTIGAEIAATPVAGTGGALCFSLSSQNYLSTFNLVPVAPDRTYRFYVDCDTNGGNVAVAVYPRLFGESGGSLSNPKIGNFTATDTRQIKTVDLTYSAAEIGMATQLRPALKNNQASGWLRVYGFWVEDVTESNASASFADISEAQQVLATAAAAAAKQSEVMSAQLASQGYFDNGNFAQWSGTTNNAPDGYVWWAGSPTYTRYSGGRYGSPYYMRMDGGAGLVNAGIRRFIYTGQYAQPFGPDQWVVIEADVRLRGGDFRGSGILFRHSGVSNQDAILDFYNDPDTAKATGNGIGAAGIRSWRKLVKMSGTYNPANTTLNLYLMNKWSAFPSSSGASNETSIDWYYVNVRPANDGEIKAQQVDDLSAEITSVSSVLATHDTQLADLETTVSTQGATISTQQTSLNGLQLRYSVTLNSNGHISGFQQNNNGTTSDFIVQADKFMVAMPGYTPKVIFGVNAAGVLVNGDLLLNNGRIITDTGTFMEVAGKGFGTSNQFLRWYGPKMALNLCSESNGVFWIKTNGDAYFGGTLSAGVLKNSLATSSTLPDASVTVGPYGTNGGPKVIALSWTYTQTLTRYYPATVQGRSDFDSDAAAYASGSYTVPSSSLALTQKAGSSTVGTQTKTTTVQTRTFSGERPVSDATTATITLNTTIAFTYTENNASLADRETTAQLTRAGGVFQTIPNYGTTSTVQRVSVVVTEE
ncbi:hypothetical protein KNJ79_05435 [Sphingopyxis indica]|uniref:phage tail protein n=1 Tax=Sphingopyxis indica TaxID=436663 RepID=UPI0029391714|nr:phage tail protein [Sphingopyxis indica]WOF44376.1 hypothetical protein KNJ79_05435 [Sphingopyxis indica]